MALRDDSWRRLAACRGLPTAMFFPDPARPDPAGAAAAKAVCAACPVRDRCAEAAGSGEHGIWGGLTLAERRAGRREHNPGAAA